MSYFSIQYRISKTVASNMLPFGKQDFKYLMVTKMLKKS